MIVRTQDLEEWVDISSGFHLYVSSAFAPSGCVELRFAGFTGGDKFSRILGTYPSKEEALAVLELIGNAWAEGQQSYHFPEEGIHDY